MQRYQIMKNDLPNVRKFLTGGKREGIPKWAVRFKEKLNVKGGKLYFEEKLIVPKEDVETYIRSKLYSKNINEMIPHGRDSGHYKLLQQTVGISRRVLMEFIRGQKNIQETKPSLNKPKRKSGIKLKKLQLQTDLIFVRKPDLNKANPKFGNDETLKHETYIITTVEAASGLVKLSYLKSKDKTTDALLQHIQWFAKQFRLKPSSMSLISDKGSEYVVSRIKKVIPDYKFVQRATACERMNRSVQKYFYRILKNRQATTITDALKKAEAMCNNTATLKHKKTALEIVEDPSISNKQIIEQHNKSRKEFKKGDNRGDFKVNDYVRVMAPDKVRVGIGYKSYKGQQYEKSVHKIIKTTTRSKVKKYRLDDKRWLTQDRLLLSKPIDQESQKIIKARIEEEKEIMKQHQKDVRDFAAAEAVVKKDEIKSGTGRRVTRRSAALKGLKKLKAQQDAGAKHDQEIAEDLALYKKEQAAKKRLKPKQKLERNVTRENSKLVTEFKKLVKWVQGEQNKQEHSKASDAAFDDKINKGRQLATTLRKDKVRLKGVSINFFKQFK